VTQPQPSPTSRTLDKPSPSSSDSACCSSCSLDGCRSAATSALIASASGANGTPPSEPENDYSDAKSYATIRTLQVHRDNRGNVRETFRASWFPTVPPIKQLVRSKSKPRTIRGMHLHRSQFDIWHIVKGAALVRTFDHLTGDDRYGWFGAGYTIAIPPGLSHGFYTPDGCILLYGLTEEYDGSDEFGWHFSDGIDPAEEYSVEWPTDPSDLNISERDLRAPRLAEFAG
jgi:dTDP-4-dehydrorhamnose 3,5-epimerase-like enzyme